jgi:DNA replication protein DnaC
MEPAVTEPTDRRARYVGLVKQLGVRYRRCDFLGYEIYDDAQLKVYQAITDIANNMPDRLKDGGGVILYGRPGTGKDHLLTALAYSAVLQWGYTLQWVNGATLYQEARQLIGDNESETKFIDKHTQSQILIISDPVPPKGEAKPYGVDVLQRIVDRRYRECLSTWATLNVHDGREAEERLASALVSRWRHDSLCILCDWADYRESRKTKS